MEEKPLKSLQDVDLSPEWFPFILLKRVPFFALVWGWRNPVKWRNVEPAGVEPASKHMPDKLSTCLFLDWISGAGRARTNLLAPYLFWFSSRTHSGHKPIPLFVDSAAGTATGSLPGGYKGCLISD